MDMGMAMDGCEHGHRLVAAALVGELVVAPRTAVLRHSQSYWYMR